MSNSDQSASSITRKAKSNLASVFWRMPAEARKDLVLFYAFCRVIDDLADEKDQDVATRQRGLQAWQQVLRGTLAPLDELQAQVVQLIKRRQLDTEPFLQIIEGCMSDLHPALFKDMPQLYAYTYRVAGCVGLISARLMGAGEGAAEFAVSLGHSLQLVNILRDIGHDWDSDRRVYLPLDLLAKHGLAADNFMQPDKRAQFRAMAKEFMAEAYANYTKASILWHKLCEADRRSLRPAGNMAEIYYRVLVKIRRLGVEQVLTQAPRLGKLAKLWVIIANCNSWLKLAKLRGPH